MIGKNWLEQFYIKPSFIKKIVLFIPAIIGFIVNAPLYFTFHLIIKNRAVDHYDSIMTGLLFLLLSFVCFGSYVDRAFCYREFLFFAVTDFDALHRLELFAIEEADQKIKIDIFCWFTV